MNKIVTPSRDFPSLEVLESEAQKISVLNPVGFPPQIVRKALAPRLESLEGKTIYLVDCRFDDSVELLRQVQAWFAAHMPDVETRIISLSATYQHDDPKTWEEIKANGDPAILGVGHFINLSPALSPPSVTPGTHYRVPTVP